MAELNKTICATGVLNTGYGGCPFDPKAYKGGFLVPAGKVYTADELADFRATLIAETLAPKGQRIYALHGFEVITDNSPEPTFQTLASGRQVLTQEGDYDITFGYVDGGLCLSNKLRSFKNSARDFDFLGYDADFQFIGTKKPDVNGEDGLAGVPLKILYPYPWKVNDFANATSYRLRLSWAPTYVNEKIGFTVVDFDPADVKGLQNINLSIVGVPAGGVFEVKCTTGCSGENMYELYSAALASISLWKMYNNATNLPIVISAVAANPDLETIKVTADTADLNYVATTATGKVRINTDTPVALDAADISGFESIPVTVVRGA